ncbi:rapamycin-insensitive companion of mTOR-like [Uloborus diversus]|uniref:rapamycin-insensitive companion of mTOR-like n=1 Tax=Uloborus diversus TaxID=327109 RepID=UPI002409CA68|nr:rapamycin-insensitive companion of mTOR-like [Uloborus diversus]
MNLRVSFFHETCEVRASGLRVCRYLLQNKEALEAFLNGQMHYLVSRSLDILLDNRIERIQALRLMRKVMSLDPCKFPRAFTNCLVAVANEGSQERDMLRPCLATLAQLTILNPSASIEARGVNALLQNVAENSHAQTAEAVLGAIFFLINHPSTRSLLRDDFSLQNLLAPFTDCHYRFPCGKEGSASEDKDPNLTASKTAIVCTLLSWPGLMYLCRADSIHLQSLIEMLYLPYPDLRRHILDLLYQLFDISVPEWTDDFNIAIASADPSAVKSSWQLYEGYVVAEGIDVLPYSSKDRMNLVYNYHSLLVLVLVHCGIIEALSKVIVTSEINLAVRATVFLGEFIYMANQSLPIDCGHLSNCLPTLIASASCFSSSAEQNQAAAALTCLCRIHELKKRGAVPNSLVLSNILHVCDPDREKKGFFSSTEMIDSIDQALKDTQVLTKDYNSWDWDLIDCILKNPNDSLKKLDDTIYRIFLKKLLHFFKPSSKEFSEMELDKENGRQICITGCHFLELLLDLDETKTQEYLDDFLNDLNTCFVQLTKDNDRSNSILSPIKVLNTYSQMYFLFIGKLSSTHKGCKFLNRCNTFQNLFHLVSKTTQDIYIKLTVSALDYTKEGFSRAILTQVLAKTEEATRLYATNFLLILLRAKLADYRKWAIEVLVTQLYDVSKIVSSAAIDILDEACQIKENLEALISLRPSLLHMGDKGLLLLIRFLSIPTGFKFLQESNFLQNELERWAQVYNLKYVKVVEDLLNEAFTHHRRSESGTYGRRSSDICHAVRNVYLPPHIYGELVQHPEGFEVLEKQDVLSNLYQTVQNPDFSSDLSILKLKASLWALGHVGSHNIGLSSLLKENTLYYIIYLAANAPVLSVRGTCFFVLGLLCSSSEGATAVEEYGWEAVKRNHEEKWPLIREEFLIDNNQFSRKYTWSFSSMSGDWLFNGFPSSLSFAARNSPRDFSPSGSQSSCNSCLEVMQNPYRNQSFAELPSGYNSEFSPGFDDSRPRSSSDCQPERNDGGLFQIAESSSWDVLSSESFSPPSNFNPRGKRRSISTSEVDTNLSNFQSLVGEGNPEGDDRGRNTISVPSTSRDSASHSVTRPTTLRPVSSNSSINSSCRSSDCDARPSLLKQLSCGQSSRLQSPTTPDNSSSLLVTSARDALGYATFKHIQRRRVNSLSFHESSSSNVDSSLRHIKSQSLDADAAKPFNVASNDMLFAETDDDSLGSRHPSQDSETLSSERYIGLCLPSNLDLIFNVPNSSSKTSENRLDAENLAASQSPIDRVFEFHAEDNCLCRHSSQNMRCLHQTTIDEESEEASSQSLNSTERSLVRAFSLDRSNSMKGAPRSKEDQLLIRKEAMRYVINLSSSVAVNASEQGLLNLKQKFPSAFQDICLYSEINYYMANYNFRMPARRFMHELFLDVTFEELQLEAESVVGIISIPQIGGSEA